MRIRRYRPTFDSLDFRLLLDGGGADAASGGVAAPAMLSVVATDGSSDNSDITTGVDWYLPGNPPNDPSDGSTDSTS